MTTPEKAVESAIATCRMAETKGCFNPNGYDDERVCSTGNCYCAQWAQNTAKYVLSSYYETMRNYGPTDEQIEAMRSELKRKDPNENDNDHVRRIFQAFFNTSS